MAICRVCRRNSADAICPHCGYQAVMPTMLNEEIERKLDELANEFRKNLMGNLKIYVKIYVYEASTSGLSFKEERKLLLLENADLSKGFRKWDEHVFGISEELALTIFIELKDIDRKYEINLVPPKKTDKWHIGIDLSEDLYVRVMVGEPGNFSVSEPIDLLRINKE